MSATAPTRCSLSPESGLEHHLPSSFLHPGKVFASATPHVIAAITGSCVAMYLFDPITGIGGMNHFAIPRAAARALRELAMNPRGMMLKMVTATGDVWVRPLQTVRPALPLAAVR